MHEGSPTSSAGMFLLFLIVTPVSPVCQTGTADECQAALIVPGYNLAGGGFDITTMTRAESKIVDMDQWKHTNGTCTLCRNTWMKGNPFQKIPLAVRTWEDMPECENKVYKEVLESVTSVARYQETMVNNTWSEGLNLYVPGYDAISVGTLFAGSHSKMMKFSTKQSSRDRNIFLRRDFFCKYYRISLAHDVPLSKHFKEEVERLPKEYNDATMKDYFRFIRIYGTHVTEVVSLGGRRTFLTSLYSCEISLSDLNAKEILSCLSRELSLAIGAESSSSSQDCSANYLQQQFKTNFKKMTTSEFTHTEGGAPGAIIRIGSKKNSYSKWLETVIEHPGIVDSVLAPIYNFVPKQDPRGKGLQKAVNDYISKRALIVYCENTCPSDHIPELNQHCSCKCSGDGLLNNMCCPKEKHMGLLTVWIDTGHHLWGDYFTETDAYVTVEFQGRMRETSTVWDNDNPRFNAVFNLGIVLLIKNTIELKIEVYDRDPWPKEREYLGGCSEDVGAGQLQYKICKLEHGYLKYRYQVVCAPHLKGKECDKYVIQSPTYKSILLDR